MFAKRFSLVLIGLLAVACSNQRRDLEQTEGDPRILLVSSLIGYVEPCGCTVDLHLGGIDRLATAVRRERKQGPTAVVVLGPTLFEKTVKPHRVPQEKVKARLLARSLQKIGIDAVAFTPNELFYGDDFFQELMPDASALEVTANGPTGGPRIVELGALKVGLFAVSPPGQKTPAGQTGEVNEAVTASVATLKSRGAHVVVGIGLMPRPELRKVTRNTKGVDIWVLGDKPLEETSAADLVGSYLVEAGDRGRNIGRLVFRDAAQPGPLRDPKGDIDRKRRRLEGQLRIAKIMALSGGPAVQKKTERLNAELAALNQSQSTGKRFEYSLVPIKQELTRSAPIAQWVDTYNASLKELNLANAGSVPPVPDGQAGYVGMDTCDGCHADAVTFWRRSKHAMAWKTLELDQKTYDAECVSCHVTGWQMPGGSILGKTQGLENVQCEVCHGPGSLHVDAGGDSELIKLNAPEKLCVNCHNDHHSPKFNYQTYMKKVIGPGHGLPLTAE